MTRVLAFAICRTLEVLVTLVVVLVAQLVQSLTSV